MVQQLSQPRKAHIYIRASTKDQKETLQVQYDRCMAEFTLRFAPEGYQLGGVYQDTNVSGSVALGSRPEGARLTRDLAKGDIVIVSKLDRGFRSLSDLMATLEKWQKREVRLVSLDFGLDTGTPVGRLVVAMLGAIAQFERERISERTREVVEQKMARGELIGDGIPYGFKAVNRGGRRMAEPDENVRMIGSRILEWHNQGWSLDRIYYHLCYHRIQHPRTRREISRTTIHRWIEGEILLRRREEAERGGEEGSTT